MAKKFWIIFALCAVIVATALLTSCDAVVPLITYVELDGDEVYECEVGDFKIENLVLNAYYNTGDVEKINVTRDMIPASEYLKLFKTGEQTIRIDYNGLSASFRINILRHSFKNEIFLEDKVFVYDGYPHSLEITGSMPEGTSVRFPTGNAFTDAGEYQVRAVIEKDGYESFELVSTLTILKADYDTSGLLFEDKKVLYSGTTQTIEISSKLPRDLHVEYEAFLEDGKTPAPRVTSEGIYIIAAHLTTDNPNYNPIPDLFATLEIQKDTYNMANIKLADVTVQYDGKSHRPEIINENKIPEDIKYSISYTTSGGKKMASAPVDAGEYTATLTFMGNDNYNDIPPVTSKVIIEKIVIDTSMLRLYSEAFKYDGQPHSLIVQGDIPKGVSVKYEGNEQIYAGKYSVTAHITCAESKNYRPTSETLTAEIVIDPIESEMPVDSYNIAFDGTAVSFVGVDESITADIKLFDSEDKEVTKPQYGVIYKFTADCRYKDENRARSETLKSDAGNVMFLDPEKIYYPSGSVLYSGEDFAALMFGKKSENVPLSYVGEYSYEVYKVDGEKRTKVSEARDVGRYVIKMSLSNSVGFGVIAPKEVELIISTISVELPSYTDLTVTYSGNENKLLWTGLPAGMEVEFYEIKVGTADPVKFAANDENLWKTTINPGVYTVTAYIKNHENFGCAESATATLTVKRMAQPTFSDKTVTYSGNPNDMSLPGIPAEDIEYYKINGTQHSPTDANLWNHTINADIYSVTVKLKEQGHYENEEIELTAILTVNKINAGSVPESYNDLHAMVDGKTHPHLPTGLPACAIITEYQINGGTKYAASNNSGWDVTKEAGNYSVTVYYSIDPNYECSGTGKMTSNIRVTGGAEYVVWAGPVSKDQLKATYAAGLDVTDVVITKYYKEIEQFKREYTTVYTTVRIYKNATKTVNNIDSVGTYSITFKLKDGSSFVVNYYTMNATVSDAQLSEWFIITRNGSDIDRTIHISDAMPPAFKDVIKLDSTRVGPLMPDLSSHGGDFSSYYCDLSLSANGGANGFTFNFTSKTIEFWAYDESSMKPK